MRSSYCCFLLIIKLLHKVHNKMTRTHSLSLSLSLSQLQLNFICCSLLCALHVNDFLYLFNSVALQPAFFHSVVRNSKQISSFILFFIYLNCLILLSALFAHYIVSGPQILSHLAANIVPPHCAHLISLGKQMKMFFFSLFCVVFLLSPCGSW